jgi:membrane-associated phospholipid phosphatase
MNFKVNKLAIILFAVIFVALAVTATFTDLWVSKTIADIKPGEYFSKNLFGVIGEVFGSFPVYYMIGLSLIILGINGVDFKYEKLFFILGIVGGFVAMLIGADDCLKDFADHAPKYEEWKRILQLLLASGFALLFEIPTVLFLKNLSTETKRKLFIFACVVLVMVIISQIFIYALKALAGRARFRAINFLGNESMFDKWFVFHGTRYSDNPVLIDLELAKDAYRSFPSGHTAATAAVYGFLCLPFIFERFNTKKWKVILYTSTIALTGYVAISRIVVGAHFFSDVLFGGTITFASVFIGAFVVNAVLKKLNLASKKQ